MLAKLSEFVRSLGWLVFLLASACSARPAQPRGVVGVFEDAGPEVDGFAADGGKLIAPQQTPSREDDMLRAQIANAAGITVKLLTLSCDGPCADIRAEVAGGNPPYELEWEDGSTAVTRRVCLKTSGELKLEVTDTAISDPEFGYEARTTTAMVTTEVIECSPEDNAADAGAPSAGACESRIVPVAKADDCIMLPPTQCATPNYFSYDLPIPLAPGHHSCLVLFSNMQFWFDPNQITLNASERECGSGPPVGGYYQAWASLEGSDDAEQGRVMCLEEVNVTYQVLGLGKQDDSWFEVDDLDLRFCEVCPL